MSTIKVKNNDEWIAGGSTNASSINTSSEKLTGEDGTSVSVEHVLEDHEDRVAKLERNVSWLAKNGGGGSGGGGGGGSSISEATCNIFVNNVETGGSVIVDEQGLNIELRDISVQATKVWSVIVRIGSVQIYSGSASFSIPMVSVPFSAITTALTNHTGNLYITASYEDELNGVYGSKSWSGTITESVVSISTPNLSIGLTSSGGLETDESFVYTYSVGIVGSYVLKIDITKDGTPVATKSYDIEIIDTNQATFSVRVAEVLSEFTVGAYVVSSQLYYTENTQIQNTIKTSLTLVSNTILISSVVMSEEEDSPTEVSLDGSINFVWTAYLQGSSTFQYTYKIGEEVIKESSIGYFGQEVNDFVSVIGKDWAVENQTSAVVVTVTVGSQSVSKTWYIKFVKSSDSFLQMSTTSTSHLVSQFLARSYNSGELTFNLENDEYLVGGRKSLAKSSITLYDTSNLVGIKTSSTQAPYLRLSNGTRGELGNFDIGGVKKTVPNILSSVNNDFTISISFKADYHPDDQRTILYCGQIDSQTGELISGFEIDVHDIYVNSSSLIRLTDNVVNNIDIVCVHSDDDYITSTGELVKERHYIVKVYLEGALSAVGNYSTFPNLSDSIYLGGKVYGELDEPGWLCDCNIYNLQFYDYALSDLDIVINYINNNVASTYVDGKFNFGIIDSELRKNFCERDAEGGVISHIYQNGAYTVDFLLNGNNLSEENLNQFAKAVGIPIMLIDVSTDDSWTFENFVNQQTADNVQLAPTSGKTISYWDPTQQNTSVLQVHNTTIELQGTSTLSDAVKNINITVPNDTVFIPKDTWLPEQTYTLKADVVDSSHSNNAAIGKFINTVLKDYFPSDPIALDNVENSNYKKNQQPTATLKHTVEGFPILLIINFHTTETSRVSTTPLGIYSFNLGRDAFRNLGFRKVNNIKDSTGVDIVVNTFPYLSESCTYDETDSNANWIEIKDTTSIADMSRLTGASLPSGFDSSVGDFWQNDSTILNQRYEVRYPQGRQAADYTTFVNFVGTVMSLPLEGLYVTENRGGTVARPEITTEYDLYKYDNGYIKTGKKQQIITDVNQLAALGFNATSMYKYFIIANFFGLADNFGKNSTYRSWQNGDYYIGFYDMDTALGGDNQGSLAIEPNMWMKYLKNEILEGKNYGFVAETFNSEDPLRLSNSVFSANHSKLWLSMDTQLMRNKLGINDVAGTSAYSYYWDDFRQTLYGLANSAGYKDTAEYFVNEYYLKQTGDCGPLLFNLDYKLKYLVQFTDDKFSNTRFLSKLHGRKAAYTLDWLRKHILFLDSVFYWRNTTQKFSYPNDLNCKLSGTLYNTPESFPVKTNTDLIIFNQVGSVTQTYYYFPKNTEVFIDAGQNTSNSIFNWGMTNSPQLIQLGDEEHPLSDMNVSVLSHTNTELYINSPGLSAITDLNLENNTEFAGGGDSGFNLRSFQPEVGVSEIRTLNFANTNSRITQGARPTFVLSLVVNIGEGMTDSKFQKLREIDISNSKCISDITLPNVPLRKLSVYNSSLTNLNLTNQNYIESVDLSGCTKLLTITIKECALYKSLSVNNLNNLQEINIVNNKEISSISVANCPNLQKVTIQNNVALKTIKITGCTKLTGNTSNNYITITDNTALTSLDLSANSSLKKVTISNSNQANITDLKLNGTSLICISGDGADETLLDLSNFTYGSGIQVYGNTEVTEIQFANDKNKPITLNTNFQNCTKLKRIYGNLIFKQTTGSLGAGMFRNCKEFSIHGDDEEEALCLGPKTWNGKGTRTASGAVRTIYATLTQDDNNTINSSTGTRPYSSITWDSAYMTGKKVTNIKMGNNSLQYMFYGTHLTEFDVMYVLFVIGQTVTSNYSLERVFYGLTRQSEEKWLFDTTVDKYGMSRFLFYKCNRCTSINELFSTSSNTTFIRSRNENYNNVAEDSEFEDDGESNGVLSPLVNCTRISRLTNGNLVFDYNVFKLATGNLKISSLSWQGVTNVVKGTDDFTENGWLNADNYSSWVSSKPNEQGDFTGMFESLPNLTSLSYIFDSLGYINFDTIKFPSGMTSVSRSLIGNITTGSIDIKVMFNGCNNLTTLAGSFVSNGSNTNYGTKAEFPISADMFASYPKLTIVGYNPSDTNTSSDTYLGKGARRFIVDDEWPEHILENNPNIQVFSHFFYGCEDKAFSTTPKFPGNMFLTATKLTNIHSILRDVNFAFTLSSGGFANCPNLTNVARAFQHGTSQTVANRSKLTGEIPAKLFYHGGNTVTTTKYGTNQVEKPDEEFDIENDLQSSSVSSFSPKTGITNMEYCFSGCLNLSYYENKDNINMVEGNADYSPYKWNYNRTSKTWTENTETKQYIDYWAYTGDPSTQNPSYKYLEGTNVELIDSRYGVANKTETLNYMCPPDLLRYCNNNCNVSGLFDYCGLDHARGIIGSNETYQSAGITGRICPYLLKPVPNTTNLSYMFRYCRRLSSYTQEGVTYQIPLEFFNYATGVTTLTGTFQGLDFPFNTRLSVFDSLKNSLDVRKIFCYCRYTGYNSQKTQISNVFANNRINYLTGAFSENDIYLNGNYNASLREYWTLDNGDGVASFSNNFVEGKVPDSGYISYVYYGWGTSNVSDPVIPINSGNNY